jgi:alanyl-tRNA synthetase
MSAIKLYYDDAYQKAAETEIISEREDKKGWWYSFAGTIFYPEGGGQDSDTGWINHERVQDVQADGQEVWHLLATRITSPVKMQLDWVRRYENMQQHTGQHILSACFKDRHNLDTLAVHLGREITMIELQASEIETETLRDTEQAANKIIREGHPVKAVWITHVEAEKVSLRRPIKTDRDDVRLINIGEIDRVGCGGIHVKSTAEVGLIKIVGTEKIRNHIRVQIKIGPSAYRYMEDLHQVLQHIASRLSTSLNELPDRIENLISEQKEQARKINRLTGLWMKDLAETLTEGKHKGCFNLNDLTANHLKTLSESWLKKHRRPCLFVSHTQDQIYFFSRVPVQGSLNLQEFLEHNRVQFSLKGGGGKDFASGQMDQVEMNDDRLNLLFQKFAEFQKTGARK